MLVEHKNKFEKAEALINKICVGPETSIEYVAPDAILDTDDLDISRTPHVLITYVVDGVHTHTQSMPLKNAYLDKSAKDLVNYITFSIEQFEQEIDAVVYGAQ